MSKAILLPMKATLIPQKAITSPVPVTDETDSNVLESNNEDSTYATETEEINSQETEKPEENNQKIRPMTEQTAIKTPNILQQTTLQKVPSKP